MVKKGQKMWWKYVPCWIGGGGEEEKDPGGDHNEAGWYVVEEDVPDQVDRVKMTNMFERLMTNNLLHHPLCIKMIETL